MIASDSISHFYSSKSYIRKGTLSSLLISSIIQSKLSNFPSISWFTPPSHQLFFLRQYWHSRDNWYQPGCWIWAWASTIMLLLPIFIAYDFQLGIILTIWDFWSVCWHLLCLIGGFGFLSWGWQLSFHSSTSTFWFWLRFIDPVLSGFPQFYFEGPSTQILTFDYRPLVFSTLSHGCLCSLSRCRFLICTSGCPSIAPYCTYPYLSVVFKPLVSVPLIG